MTVSNGSSANRSGTRPSAHTSTPADAGFTRSRIRKLALAAAVHQGDAYPTSIRYVFSRNNPASRVLGFGGGNQGNYKVVAVVIRGRFVSGPTKADPTASVLKFLVDERTGDTPTFGIGGGDVPDLASLGPVTTIHVASPSNGPAPYGEYGIVTGVIPYLGKTGKGTVRLYATSNNRPTRLIGSKNVTAADNQFIFTPPPGEYALTLKLNKAGVSGGCYARKGPVDVQVRPGPPTNATLLLGCNIIY